MDFQAQEENLMFAANDVIRRAQQRDSSERGLVANLNAEGTGTPCVAITEGYTIRLKKVSIVMMVEGDKVVCIDFDPNRLHPWATSSDYRIETVCLEPDFGWAYVINWTDGKVWLPQELYLRAEAEDLYFVGCVTRRYKPEVHFAYTDDPSLRIILDRFVAENQKRVQKEVTENE